MVLGFTSVFAHWALRPGRGIWSEQPATNAARNVESTQAATHVLSLINQAMERELWRRESLTIGEIAEEIAVSEHRLRDAINRELGYRNFPAFINGYRINAAQHALVAPTNARRTILEIAYECGFASLGPFNKAFRAQTGTSPRDYRCGIMTVDLVDS